MRRVLAEVLDGVGEVEALNPLYYLAGEGAVETGFAGGGEGVGGLGFLGEVHFKLQFYKYNTDISQKGKQNTQDTHLLFTPKYPSQLIISINKELQMSYSQLASHPFTLLLPNTHRVSLLVPLTNHTLLLIFKNLTYSIWDYIDNR